ncbi:uncharacterized protein CC84DRAFT_1223662 [Paraphaeosphaeria sporulosa]|uniref:Uncharacterized protein n=1 Tax=Paraphaeosphaeria sporulosa TaxID=1460663 RepID=A0A177BVT1_9PLEO|nr:uncharacterized protein CC84DRAFT_1223662 [Paraphaeosphaeria sporulosa]OAF98667.1 hypothetical protein CC84DRAFT_1223662 [Paraphaeosphaeria sporulosa]
MESPQDFWARKIGQLRGVQPPSSEPEKDLEEPTPAQASAPKKNGGSLAFKAPSKLPVTPSTTMKWADYDSEDEDEHQVKAEAEAEANDAHQKAHESGIVTNAVARQAKRLDETEATVERQAQRIDELSGEIKDQASRIVRLQATINEKTVHVADLKADVTEKDAHIVDLIRQAHEETHRAMQLEDELERKNRIIETLQLQIAESTSIPDSGSATEVEVDEGAVEASLSQPGPETSPIALEPKKLDELVDPADTAPGAMQNTLEKPAKSQATSSTADVDFPALSPVEFPALGTPTPVRDLRLSPFVTAENIKKMPPPPPARTIKMAVDLSKYQKQPAGGSKKFVFGSRHATEAPPKIDVSKDIRAMSKEERKPFGYGPTVQITMGNETVAAVPKYVFMQVSFKAFKHWTDNPNAAAIRFEGGSMGKDALNVVLDWMTMHTYCKSVFSIKLRPENSDRQNLQLVRCARVLGLHPMYVSQFTRGYCEQVRYGPSKELVALIEELVYTEDDPIFDCLANCMAMERSMIKPEHIGSWDDELARLPKLARKVQDVRAQKNFASGKTHSKEKKVIQPTKAAERVRATTTTITAEADIDPEAAWRATGPAYV